jgi:hypothetical protein
MRLRIRTLILGVILLMPVFQVLAGTESAPGGLEQTVDYLIDYVAESGRPLIRNGKRYSSAEGAEHMQKKYDHFRDRIDTPEDFIALAASKSLVTGKPYLVVIDAQGTTMPTSEWLEGVLAEYRRTRFPESTVTSSTAPAEAGH